jgi:hypothetical protein
LKTPFPRPIPRSRAKPPVPASAKRSKPRETYAKVAVVAASGTFVAAKLVDVALIGSGLAAAAGSVAFAGFMLMQDDDTPRVNGMEYLSVFAAPRGTVNPSPPATDVAADPSGIDMTPIGSIWLPATTARSDYAFVSARPNHAWVRAGSRIFAVHPGDVLPNLGKVAAIRWSDDRWVILGDHGETLLSSVDGVSLANPKGNFDKPLILDGRAD